MNYNCTCDDGYPSKTLAEMVALVIGRLGFVTPKAATTRTLLSLRTSIARRLGFSAQMAGLVPGTNELIDDFINEARQSIYRRYAYDAYGDLTLPLMVDDDDDSVIDGEAVFLLALANAKSHHNQDAKPYYEQYGAYMDELLARSPLNLTAFVTGIVQEAQELLYQRYNVLRTERWFTWSMTTDERFYDLPENDEQTAEPACTKQIDPRKLSWVGVSQGDESWRPLIHGIDPVCYRTSLSSIPSHYEVRQCIEVWPAPSDDTWKLRIKGHFGLGAFAADSDTTTIDWQAILLLATANAKAHYKQADAGNYAQQLTVYIGDLVAGSHQTARYFPGRRERPAAAPPVMV